MSAMKIWERLWVGSIFDAETLAQLNPQRLATLITLSSEAAPYELPRVNHIFLRSLGDRAIPGECSA